QRRGGSWPRGVPIGGVRLRRAPAVLARRGQGGAGGQAAGSASSPGSARVWGAWRVVLRASGKAGRLPVGWAFAAGGSGGGGRGGGGGGGGGASGAWGGAGGGAGGPGGDGRGGGRWPWGGGRVRPGRATGPAWRGGETRPAPPSQQVSASAVSGPTP